MVAVASRPERAADSRSALSAPRLHWWLLAGIVLLGAVLRFSTLGEQSFWVDEATTWQIVAHGLRHVLHQVPQTESTPPLYYVLLWCWSRVFGLGEAGLRSLSAVFGTATIVVMWAIGRRVASELPLGGAPPVQEVDVVWLQRSSPWGAISPIAPVPLPGFRLEPMIRTSSYVVLRYRAPQPTSVPYAALGHLYPVPSLALLQHS